MKRTYLFIIICANAIICNGQGIIDSLENKARNNQIPEKWNLELFQKDKEWSKERKTEPLGTLAFPIEKYEYYVFSKPFNFQIDQSHFSGIAFGENKMVTENNYVFKHEMAIIFYTGNKDYQINGDVSSRNYPYLTVQGQFDLNNVYDFIGIKSPEDSGYLIVNLKLFDLRFGQTIIIFPNTDNSFYYLQSDQEPITNGQFDLYLEELKKDNRISEMIKLIKG